MVCLPIGNSIGNPIYCEKHKKNILLDELKKQGLTPCNNYTRGCVNAIKDKYARCEECRIKERVAERGRRRKRKEFEDKHNSEHSDSKICVYCGVIHSVDMMDGCRCKTCAYTYHESQYNRNIKPDTVTQLKEGKRMTKKCKRDPDRKIWDLNDECALTLFSSPCHYCNKLIGSNGIDRVDSNKCYKDGNVVPCCSACNYMKGIYSIQKFIDIVTFILYQNEMIDFEMSAKQYDYFISLFDSAHHGNYDMFVTDGKKRNISINIDKDKYYDILTGQCAYCYLSNAGGIDRIDSRFGYTEGNIDPCCYCLLYTSPSPRDRG